jgi:hypothetical protein
VRSGASCREYSQGARNQTSGCGPFVCTPAARRRRTYARSANDGSLPGPPEPARRRRQSSPPRETRRRRVSIARSPVRGGYVRSGPASPKREGRRREPPAGSITPKARNQTSGCGPFVCTPAARRRHTHARRVRQRRQPASPARSQPAEGAPFGSPALAGGPRMGESAHDSRGHEPVRVIGSAACMPHDRRLSRALARTCRPPGNEP